MAKTKHAFRHIVLRRPMQQDLFAPEAPCQRSTLIATNRKGEPEVFKLLALPHTWSRCQVRTVR